MTREQRRPRVLLVEDNAHDIRFIKRAFEQGRTKPKIDIVHDGSDALAHLRRIVDGQGAAVPDLILLDLNLPLTDGHVVLEEIKHSRALRNTPVIVLTLSSSRQDIERAYANHANAYVTKPTEFLDYSRLVDAVESFWFDWVVVPHD